MVGVTRTGFGPRFFKGLSSVKVAVFPEPSVDRKRHSGLGESGIVLSVGQMGHYLSTSDRNLDQRLQ